MERRGRDWCAPVVLLAAALATGLAAAGCGSSSASSGLSLSATTDVRAMAALVGAGQVPTYRAVYTVTGPGGATGTLVVNQRPPLASYAQGGTTVRVSADSPHASELAGVVVSRPVLLGVVEHDGQLIEEGNPGGALATVARVHRTLGGQSSTCLTVTGAVGRHVICTTPDGIPTEVVLSGTHAVLVSLSSTVDVGELAPPAG